MTLPIGTTRNTSENTYMTYAHYACLGSTRMLDGSTYRTVLCDAAGEWSDVITDCTGTVATVLLAFFSSVAPASIYQR